MKNKTKGNTPILIKLLILWLQKYKNIVSLPIYLSIIRDFLYLKQINSLLTIAKTYIITHLEKD